MSNLHTFRPHASFGGTYIESPTFAGIRDSLRAHMPSSVKFRAIKSAGDNYHTVLMLSTHIQGPIIAGYYNNHEVTA
jgi:hypothetical protein